MTKTIRIKKDKLEKIQELLMGDYYFKDEEMSSKVNYVLSLGIKYLEKLSRTSDEKF